MASRRRSRRGRAARGADAGGATVGTAGGGGARRSRIQGTATTSTSAPMMAPLRRGKRRTRCDRWRNRWRTCVLVIDGKPHSVSADPLVQASRPHRADVGRRRRPGFCSALNAPGSGCCWKFQPRLQTAFTRGARLKLPPWRFAMASTMARPRPLPPAALLRRQNRRVAMARSSSLSPGPRSSTSKRCRPSLPLTMRRSTPASSGEARTALSRRLRIAETSSTSGTRTHHAACPGSSVTFPGVRQEASTSATAWRAASAASAQSSIDFVAAIQACQQEQLLQGALHPQHAIVRVGQRLLHLGGILVPRQCQPEHLQMRLDGRQRS